MTAAVPGAVEPGVAVSPIDGVDASEVPADTTNLAWRAVEALARRADRTPDVRIGLRKAIPVAGGMAGGSADAAGALLATSSLWRLDLGRDDLMEVAAEVGSDVAFALHGGTALGTGRGERLVPVLSRHTFHWVVAVADHGLSTPTVFAELDRLRDRPEAPRRVGDVEPVLEALASGEARSLALLLGNDLQAAAVSLDPGLRRTLRAGVDAGALAGVVSGSGPTCVFLCAGQDAAVRVAAELAGAGVCRTVRVAHGPVPGARVTDGGGPPPRRPAPAQLRPRPGRLRLTCPARSLQRTSCSLLLCARTPRSRPWRLETVPNLVNLESVSIGFGGPKPVLDGVSLGVDTGDRIGVVGRNGGGKSTLVEGAGRDADARRRPPQPRRRAADGAGQPADAAVRGDGPRRRARRAGPRPRVGRRRPQPRGRRGPAPRRRPGPRRARSTGSRAASASGSPCARRWCRTSTSWCSTSPPTTSTSRASAGSPSTCSPAAPRSSSSPTTAGSSTPSRRAPGRSSTGTSSSTRAATATGSSPAPSAPGSRTPPSSAGRTSPARSSRGCGAGRRRARPSRSTGSRPPRRSSPTCPPRATPSSS